MWRGIVEVEGEVTDGLPFVIMEGGPESGTVRAKFADHDDAEEFLHSITPDD